MPCNLVVYRATVIGAGPAGLACVGNLLDTLPSSDKILWIDPQFQVGRFSSYPSVPQQHQNLSLHQIRRRMQIFRFR